MACSVAAVGEGTQAVLAPAIGCWILALTMAAISPGMVHMPLPIWAQPRSPQARPVSTLEFSYAPSQAAALISVFGITGPASMSVWISSPVRSRKPVLMNTTRSRARAMHSLSPSDVRRSSSMIPILRVRCTRPRASSTRLNSSQARATSSGPCILGLTM